jgi:protein gp37
MAEFSKIQWTSATFNPWRGCTKVSEGCLNCYAEQMSGRNPAVLGEWGPEGTRVVAAESYWRGPVAWNRDARKAGERRRVFCASLADVFEGPETMPTDDGTYSGDVHDFIPSLGNDHIAEARNRLFTLIDGTPHLDWLLLTKRPQNVGPLYGSWLHWTATQVTRATDYPPNVWLGASTENQKRFDERAPHVARFGSRVRFLSAEPLLGPIDMRKWLDPGAVNWVIVGGESGPGARPFNPDWARVLRDQCADAGVPFFFKQLGEVNTDRTVRLGKKLLGVLDEIPADLRVREFPASV